MMSPEEISMYAAGAMAAIAALAKIGVELRKAYLEFWGKTEEPSMRALLVETHKAVNATQQRVEVMEMILDSHDQRIVALEGKRPKSMPEVVA